MKTIIIKTIPHDQQRYPTVGDYEEFDDRIEIRVSEMGCDVYEQLVAVHELVEKVLCNARGVVEADIDQFDINFENNRKKGDDSEPGDSLSAPYHEEHFFATNIERMLSLELGVSWANYDKMVRELDYDGRTKGNGTASPSVQKGTLANVPAGRMGVGGRSTQ